ncbi:MAG: hypothetical protein ACK4FF_05365 [Limnobacter sp.]|uniref:hypothetical protein n=1 Tax=Limnobacter sp. TaxID=2003368 RepID=UPI00391ACF74
MAEITHTVSIKSKSHAEYEKAVARLESEQAKSTGWTLNKEPLLLRVTATKVQEMNDL